MHKNLGDTLVAQLRLGDRLWIHGVDYGDVIALQLLSSSHDDNGRPAVTITTIGGELDGGRVRVVPMLVVDHVHVGTEPLYPVPAGCPVCGWMKGHAVGCDLYPVPTFDGTRAPVQAVVDELDRRRSADNAVTR